MIGWETSARGRFSERVRVHPEEPIARFQRIHVPVSAYIEARLGPRRLRKRELQGTLFKGKAR